MVSMMEISAQLQAGHSRSVKRLVEQALAEGECPEQILQEGLLHGMSIIGEKFKRNEVFVPEVLISAKAMNVGIDAIRPYLQSDETRFHSTAIIGTVKGDLHDIGKNILKIMLESRSIQTVDLGMDVAAEKFVDAAVEHRADLICCSALLTTTMKEMRTVIHLLKDRGLREKVLVLVGGAPLTQNYCDLIGADGYAPDAASGAELAIRLLQKKKNI